MYPTIYQSDSLTIGSYGLMLAIAYLVGRWFFLKQLASQSDLKFNSEILIILLLTFGVVGAKLMFLIKNPDKSHLLYSGTGFSSQGALLGAIVASFLFTYLNKVSLDRILDNAAPAAILAYAIARVGCFLSGDDCYGIATNLPWAMDFPDGIAPTDEHVHPVPLYEIIYSAIIFLILTGRNTANSKPYESFFLLLGLWGVCRFAVEFISANEKLMMGMSGSQVGALLMTITSIFYFAVIRKKFP
ncbi:MAG: prolipoprotein diacylglyceryl transferase [Kangiellaceae bacterium]